jgi:hypothetical protein
MFLAWLALTEATGVGGGACSSWCWSPGSRGMVLIVFKPALGTPERDAPRTFVVAAPMAMTMWFAFVLLAFVANSSGSRRVRTPTTWRCRCFTGEKEADVLNGKDLIVKGCLATAATRKRRLWREQARISEIFDVSLALRTTPGRNQ